MCLYNFIMTYITGESFYFGVKKTFEDSVQQT
jgi:hypothetical protein